MKKIEKKMIFFSKNFFCWGKIILKMSRIFFLTFIYFLISNLKILTFTILLCIWKILVLWFEIYST